MKLTLLDMTQSILSDMDSDEVNSISDTTESRQVSGIIKETFFNIVSRANLPQLEEIFSLDPSGDPLLPVLMTVPTTVSKVKWIKYFREDSALAEYLYVNIVPIEQFLEMTQRTDATEPDTGSMTLNGKIYYFKNNGQPTMCTVLNNFYVIFNSYDSSLDTTLQSSKTLCLGRLMPVFNLTDTFIPDLDDQQFPLLLNEAKSACFIQLKQISNDVSERDAKRQWTSLSKNKRQADIPSDFDSLSNFGRLWSTSHATRI